MDTGDGGWLAELGRGFHLLRQALGAAKDAKDLIENPTQREAVETTLVEAERQIQIAEAQMAKSLGFLLCQCQWPPPICLQVGYVVDNYQNVPQLKCPKCGELYPNPDRREPEMPQPGGAYY